MLRFMIALSGAPHQPCQAARLLRKSPGAMGLAAASGKPGAAQVEPAEADQPLIVPPRRLHSGSQGDSLCLAEAQAHQVFTNRTALGLIRRLVAHANCGWGAAYTCRSLRG